jgi:hypothetical protein
MEVSILLDSGGGVPDPSNVKALLKDNNSGKGFFCNQVSGQTVSYESK